MPETPDELRRREDLRDYGNEIAGIDAGRIERFGIISSGPKGIREKERKERAYRDALARLLAEDPEYRALYEDLGNRLREAETAADIAISAIQEALATVQQDNANMRSQAPKIDGRAVFRYRDGRVVDEDGRAIDPLIGGGIIWPNDAPSAEEYFTGVQREAELAEALMAWDTYRNDTLGDIRNRYDDRDNPMSVEEMRGVLTEIEAAMPTQTIHAEHTETDVRPETALNTSAFPSFVD